MYVVQEKTWVVQVGAPHTMNPLANAVETTSN
jgi:hypothetical protein